MYFPPQTSLEGYQKINKDKLDKYQEIPQCYGMSTFLIQRDGVPYVAKFYYPSWIRDDHDTGISPYHSEIMAMDRLNNGVKTIYQYYGYNDRGIEGKAIIVFEYTKGKTLRDVILKNFDQLSDTNQFKIIFGIALGMKYAHQKGVCHRDLNTENILIDSNFEPKICNFESSKVLETDDSGDELTTTVRGRLVYMDPNIYNNEDEGYNPKLADVYSFALIMFYVLGGKPTNNLRRSFSRSFVDKRPNIYEVDSRFHQLISNCWSTEESSRPSFNDIVEYLKNKEMWIGDENEIEDYLRSFDPQLLKNSDTTESKESERHETPAEEHDEKERHETPAEEHSETERHETPAEEHNVTNTPDPTPQRADPTPPRKKRISAKSFMPKITPV